MTHLNLILLVTLYTLAGVVCLVWPRRVQALVLRRSSDVGLRYARLLDFVRSHRYIWTLRLVGVLSAIAAILLIDSAARAHVTTPPPQRYIRVDLIRRI